MDKFMKHITVASINLFDISVVACIIILGITSTKAISNIHYCCKSSNIYWKFTGNNLSIHSENCNYKMVSSINAFYFKYTKQIRRRI